MIFSFGNIRYDLGSRTFIMGILNVTPDSFSDGQRYFKLEDAVKRGLELADEGADFVDVGGESTKPGAEPISVNEELRRVLPVIEKLVNLLNIPISIDTHKSVVAEKALNAGALLINDISGLHFDPELAKVAARHNASVILMHIKGTPQTMQINPEYDDVVKDISAYLQEGINIAKKEGISQIILDPGIGFGKNLGHNLEILRRLSEFRSFGYPVLVGPSRKSFIGKILDLPVEERLEGTAAAVAVSIMNGADIVRVHDVKEMKRIAQVVDSVVRS